VSEFIQFAVLGLASGALYVLLALGIVIVHRGSGVVNFAQGAQGMLGTYIFWELNVNSSWPYWAAAAAGVGSSALLGIVIHFGAMRPLRNSAVLTRVIATLAVLTVLESFASLVLPSAPLVVPSELPTTPVRLLDATVGENYLLIFGVAAVLTAILTWVFRFTQFGRATIASSENRRALSSLGFSPDSLAAANWAIGGALASIAGILLAPITGLSITGFTLLIVPALAAAVIGNLASFPLALAGGLLLGVLQSETSRYVSTPGWSEAAPFFVIIAVLVVRGRDRGLRTSLAQRLPRVGTGRVRLRVVIPPVLLAVAAIQILPAAWNDATTTTLGTALILLSLVIVTGYSGQLSLAQFAFAGWGAWVAGTLAAHHGFSFPLAIIVGSAAALPLGLLVGVVCLRMGGVNLTIATLGLAVALENIVFDSPTYTDLGQISVPEPRVGGLDVGDIAHSNRYAILVLLSFAVCAVALANLRRGRSGRRMLAVRANERAAASLGIGVTGAKLAAFGLASVVAALGGSLLAFRDPSIVYSNYTSLGSVGLVSQGVVGGIGWIAGALLGGLQQVGSLLSHVLDLLGNNVSNYIPLAGGIMLLLILVTAPDGMALLMWENLGQIRQKLGVPRKPPAPPHVPAVPASRVRPRRLSVNEVTVQFGGVTALSRVSLGVGPGEIVGLIGPNGAGKTTFIDVVTGYVPAASGTIRLDEVDISRWSTTRIARHGLTRSFQSVELFDDMTVVDNLRAASEGRQLSVYASDLVWPRAEPLTSTTSAAIREFDLERSLNQLPAELSYGQRRLVGIARAVATDASILLLDEPVAGLDDHEKVEVGNLIRRLADQWGMGILLIEHDVELVLRLCDRVHVLNFGEELAVGTPQEVRNNPAVVEAYLGGPRDEDANIAPTDDPASCQHQEAG
jgi:ABC-type branched-subunit amino acid transport system ATPase component/branched-subunit amino acid ABC-type transport system permease component